jgi:anaerobic selenocysteine-containing dehydrogenase
MERTYCRICESACGLLVERDAGQRIVRLSPDKHHPSSHGFVCAKGTRFVEVSDHPERLISPMLRREDGTLGRITWEEALDVTERKLRPIRERHGPHSIGIYFGNPIAFNALGSLALLGFTRALGTRNVYSAGSQDCNNKFAGAEILHGSPVIHPIPDLENARLAVLFGTNPLVSQSSFVHLPGGSLAFQRMIDRGGEIVWIDPRRTESAARWGDHLPIRPGTDVFLLFALLRELRHLGRPDDRVEGLEELLALADAVTPKRAAEATGLSRESIERLAQRIAASPSTTFHLSVGVNQGPFGTLCYVALHALAYLTGNLDRAGGLLFHPLSVKMADAFRVMGIGRARHRSRIGGFESVLDALPGGILADEILTPGDEKIRAMVVIAGDPLASIPGSSRLDEAFRSLDFSIGIDMFENTTGRRADLLLPATSWLERWDFATTTATFQTTSLLQISPAMSPPRGEARHEAEILGRLSTAITGRRLPALLSRFLPRRLPSPEYGISIPSPRAGTYLGRGPRTPGHRVRFFAPALVAEGNRLRDALARPRDDGFLLVGRRRRLGHNGWLHDARHDGDPEAAAWMSGSDLAELGIPTGGTVEVTTTAGAMTLEAVPNESVASRTIVIPHGVPGLNVNGIIPSGPEAIERLSGQHRMTGIPARVLARPSA